MYNVNNEYILERLRDTLITNYDNSLYMSMFENNLSAAKKWIEAIQSCNHFYISKKHVFYQLAIPEKKYKWFFARIQNVDKIVKEIRLNRLNSHDFELLKDASSEVIINTKLPHSELDSIGNRIDYLHESFRKPVFKIERRLMSLIAMDSSIKTFDRLDFFKNLNVFFNFKDSQFISYEQNILQITHKCNDFDKYTRSIVLPKNLSFMNSFFQNHSSLITPVIAITNNPVLETFQSEHPDFYQNLKKIGRYSNEAKLYYLQNIKGLIYYLDKCILEPLLKVLNNFAKWPRFKEQHIAFKYQLSEIPEQNVGLIFDQCEQYAHNLEYLKSYKSIHHDLFEMIWQQYQNFHEMKQQIDDIYQQCQTIIEVYSKNDEWLQTLQNKYLIHIDFDIQNISNKINLLFKKIVFIQYDKNFLIQCKQILIVRDVHINFIYLLNELQNHHKDIRKQLEAKYLSNDSFHFPVDYITGFYEILKTEVQLLLTSFDNSDFPSVIEYYQTKKGYQNILTNFKHPNFIESRISYLSIFYDSSDHIEKEIYDFITQKKALLEDKPPSIINIIQLQTPSNISMREVFYRWIRRFYHFCYELHVITKPFIKDGKDRNDCIFPPEKLSDNYFKIMRGLIGLKAVLNKTDQYLLKPYIDTSLKNNDNTKKIFICEQPHEMAQVIFTFL